MEDNIPIVKKKFKKGMQRVPGSGRKKVVFNAIELKDMLQGVVPEAVATIVEVMKEARVANDKLKAAMWILERVYGKSREVIEHGGRVEIAVNRPPVMSRDEWLRVYGVSGAHASDYGVPSLSRDGVGMKAIEAPMVEEEPLVIDVTPCEAPSFNRGEPIEIGCDDIDPAIEVIAVHRNPEEELINDEGT